MATLMSIACSNTPKNDIECAAQGYLDAMGNYLPEEAIPYATSFTREHTIPTIRQIITLSDTAYMNSNKPATITIHSSRMLSDTTAVVYYHKSTPIKEVDDSVAVVLEEGKWLVDFRMPYIPFLNVNKDSVNRQFAIEKRMLAKNPNALNLRHKK